MFFDYFFVYYGGLLVVFFFFFFFFKQKTAYEMRISDWSSDVCSSDLVTNRINASPSGMSVKNYRYFYLMTIYVSGIKQIERGQIGRASCRERVCQYV